MSKTSTPKFVRTCYPYHQDGEGLWWTVNPQIGWVEVPETSRALQDAISRGGAALS